MPDTMTVALILLGAKLVVDIGLGTKALKEVGLLRGEMGKLREAVTGKLEDHEKRLDVLENK